MAEVKINEQGNEHVTFPDGSYAYRNYDDDGELHNTVFVEQGGGMFVVFSPMAQSHGCVSYYRMSTAEGVEERILSEDEEFNILARVEKLFN